ncbi:MAG TPA: OmpA family protein [Candidatus Acidoferrum sp.]|jgi:outer membrane protein OmpA-like peptidoglycan-associated protein
MRIFVGMVLCCLLLVCAVNVRAQDEEKRQDAEGCKDSPLITRFPGGTINSCENKEFEQADLPMGNDKDGNAITKHVEGDYHYWEIATRPGVSEIQVFRNFQTAIKTAGFTIDYASSPNIITAHKGHTWLLIDNKGDFYYQTIVTEKEMTQEVTADASSLSDEINKSGHVAVYGIQFDTAKATIKPESEGVLGEIVKLLQQNPDLKLRVEGHTDNQGNAAANQALSEKRAQAVVAWLVAQQIGAGRLTAKGMGQTKPVEDNSTEAGRAKNRRVELVKQ